MLLAIVLAATITTEEAARILCDQGSSEAEEVTLIEENGEVSRFIFSVQSERDGRSSKCQVIINNVTEKK